MTTQRDSLKTKLMAVVALADDSLVQWYDKFSAEEIKECLEWVMSDKCGWCPLKPFMDKSELPKVFDMGVAVAPPGYMCSRDSNALQNTIAERLSCEPLTHAAPTKGRAMEEVLLELFTEQGYDITNTSKEAHSGDMRIDDILIESKNKPAITTPDRNKFIDDCKLTKAKGGFLICTGGATEITFDTVDNIPLIYVVSSDTEIVFALFKTFHHMLMSQQELLPNMVGITQAASLLCAQLDQLVASASNACSSAIELKHSIDSLKRYILRLIDPVEHLPKRKVPIPVVTNAAVKVAIEKFIEDVGDCRCDGQRIVHPLFEIQLQKTKGHMIMDASRVACQDMYLLEDYKVDEGKIYKDLVKATSYGNLRELVMRIGSVETESDDNVK